MAHIQKRIHKDGKVRRYEVRWTERVRDGAGSTTAVRHRQKSFRSMREAQEFKPLHEASALQGTVQNYNAAGRSFGHYADVWMDRLRGEIKPRTAEGYEQVMRKHVLPVFGHRAVGTISVSEAVDFRAALMKRGLSPSAVRYAFGPLRRALDLAVEDRAIPFNPAAGVRMPTARSTGRGRHKPRFLTADEVGALAVALAGHEPYDLLVLFLAYSGLRAGEAAGLDVRHVRLTAAQSTSGIRWSGYVDVDQTRRKIKGGWETSTPKSDDSVRRVPLPGWLAEDLHTYLTETHPHGDDPAAPLWPNRRNGGYTHGIPTVNGGPGKQLGDLAWDQPWERNTFYRNIFKPALRRAGLPVSSRTTSGVRLHDLRHTYASICASEGVDIYRVSKRMGHASIAITVDTYSHLFAADDAADMARLARPGRVRLA